jgi:hypothetical protein
VCKKLLKAIIEIELNHRWKLLTNVITIIKQNHQKLILKMLPDGNIINELPLGQNNQKFILNIKNYSS